jgi:hypothetical protein
VNEKAKPDIQELRDAQNHLSLAAGSLIRAVGWSFERHPRVHIAREQVLIAVGVVDRLLIELDPPAQETEAGEPAHENAKGD